MCNSRSNSRGAIRLTQVHRPLANAHLQSDAVDSVLKFRWFLGNARLQSDVGGQYNNRRMPPTPGDNFLVPWSC